MNVEYVRYAMETLPEGAAFKELRVEYKKPARYDDEVLIAVIQAEGKHQVVMRDQEGDVSVQIDAPLTISFPSSPKTQKFRNPT